MCLKCGVRWEKTVHELENIQTSKIVEGLEYIAKEFVLCRLGSGEPTKISVVEKHYQIYV